MQSWTIKKEKDALAKRVNKFSVDLIRKYIWLALLICLAGNTHAQVNLKSELDRIDYTHPKKYEIGGITVSGVKYLDPMVLVHLTDLQVGDTIEIPGERITQAVEKLWDQGLFSDVSIVAQKVVNKRIFLDIKLKERSRLSRFSFKGIRNSEADDLREQIELVKGAQVTENILMNTERIVRDYFIDKGFRYVDVNLVQKRDTLAPNTVRLSIDVRKNERVKINEIIIKGNEVLSEGKIKRTMKNTKQKAWWRFYKSSKFIEDDFKEDKESIISKYNEEGFRDARIVKDSVIPHDENTIDLVLKLEEGDKFFIRSIDWLGNTKYSNKELSRVLGIERGDVYNQKVLDERLLYGPNSVFSLYQDNGYLFSNITPVEVNVEKDSIDFEMRIYEGKQARINRMKVTGNTRTHDHVVIREVRSRPGDLYKRSDIQRTIRELSQLGYFNPETLNVDFEPDPANGTVDLEYLVEEKPSDQVELSGGWGAGMIVGTLGLSFNNFSLRNIFNPSAYRPLPTGDGQRLSLRAQASGPYYQSYSFTFVEPWLGGRKPNSLSFSVYHSIQSTGASTDSLNSKFKITGASLGLGRRLERPDDFFTLHNELSYKHYDIYKWSGFIYDDGVSNNVSLRTALGRRSSGPNPIYPIRGSDFSMSLELTPPYSVLADNDYDSMTAQEKYRWIEYHKWKFSGKWFTPLTRSKEGSKNTLVLLTKFEFGFLGYYNKELGPSPFEGFQVGGDGLYGYNLYGRETIGLRGYTNNSLTPDNGGNLYNKFTLEMRYPLSLNPTATFYALAFLEGGNAWYDFREYDPFDMKRSAGVGVRVYMPMIGMLGVDWGYGFDEIEGASGVNGANFHFVIGQQF